MRKNAQIHLRVETELVNLLRKQAEERKISISELCRQKIREAPQLSKIEYLMEEINRKFKYQSKHSTGG